MREPASPYRVPHERRRRAPEPGRPAVIGLTGGIASGKTTVARILAEEGARVLSADRVGHAVLDEPEVREALAAAFGAEVLAPGGAVDRKRLGALVFADPAELARLNAIVHPRLLAHLGEALERALAEGGGPIVLEAALLVEWDLGGWCDRVIAVTAPVEARVARAAARHGLTPAQARERIERQLPDEVRVRYADRTLVNDGDLDELERQARALARTITERRPDRAAPSDAGERGASRAGE